MDLHLCQLGCCDSPNACDLCHGSGVRTTPFSNKLRIVQLHVLDPALDPALCLTLSKDLDLSLCHWVDAREILLAEGDRIKRVTLPGHTQPTGHLIKVGPGAGSLSAHPETLLEFVVGHRPLGTYGQLLIGETPQIVRTDPSLGIDVDDAEVLGSDDDGLWAMNRHLTKSFLVNVTQCRPTDLEDQAIALSHCSHTTRTCRVVHCHVDV